MRSLVLVAFLCGQGAYATEPNGVAELLGAGEKANAAAKWAEASAAYRRAEQLAVASGDTKSQAAALTGMASAEYGKANYAQSERLARQALSISESQGSEAHGDQVGISAALQQIANVQYRRGDFQGSKATIERALAIREKLGDRAGIAMAYNNLGNASRQLGDKLQALDYLSRAEHEFAKLGNERRRAVALNNIGIGYGELGDYERGLEYSHQSMEIASRLSDNSRLGNALNNIAVIETYQGNYGAAQRHFQQALEADERIGARWEVAEATNNIGLVYRAQGNHEQAVAFFTKALDLNRAVGDKSIDADGHCNIGSEMLSMNRLEDAEKHYRECLALAHASSYQLVEAGAHEKLAQALFRRKRYGETEAEIRTAAEIQRKISDKPNLAGSLGSLAYLKLVTGDAPEALRLARESEEMLASIDRPETLWQTQLAEGQALRTLHRDLEAARAFDNCIATIESLRTRVSGPPTALPVYFANKLEPYAERVAIALEAGRPEEALEYVERSKARGLGDLLKTSRIRLDKTLTAEERGTERTLENRLVASNLKVEAEPAAAGAREVQDRARRELDALQTALYSAHPETAFQRGVPQAVTVAQMKQAAEETGAVILDYFLTPRVVYVFVVRPGQPARATALSMAPAQLTAKAEEFHRLLASHDLGYAGTAQELYRALLHPVEEQLTGQSAWIVIPDGALWDVPFQALQPRAGRFLIEDAAISYAPSVAVLRETLRVYRQRVASPAAGELLALGEPAGRASIPGAERQLRGLETLYGPAHSRVLTGEAASEVRLKTEAPRYRVIHLASHTVLDETNPMYSHALLAPSSGEDGSFEARELMALDLKADLLVLSSCDTARGRAAAGEGITGMLWAAFVAGAPTTVAAQWAVESNSTADLMVAFHRHYLAARQAGSTFAKASALREAALELISSGEHAHPFFWAAFAVEGSPN